MKLNFFIGLLLVLTLTGCFGEDYDYDDKEPYEVKMDDLDWVILIIRAY